MHLIYCTVDAKDYVQLNVTWQNLVKLDRCQHGHQQNKTTQGQRKYQTTLNTDSRFDKIVIFLFSLLYHVIILIKNAIMFDFKTIFSQ